MGKHLRHEVYVLLRRWPALLLILAALIGNYWLGGVNKVAGAGGYDRRIDAKCFWLMTRTEFEGNLRGYEYYIKYTHRTVEEIVESYGLTDAGITELEEIYPLLAGAQYRRCLWFLGGLLFLCMILPPVLIRDPMNSGVPALAARLTRSGRTSALAKIMVYDLCVLLISLISTLIQIGAYAGSIVSQAGFAYVLGTVLLRLLLDLAVLSVPMYLAFLIRRIPGLVAVEAAYGVVCYILNVAACNSDKLLPIPIPAYLHGLRPLWQQGGPAGWIVLATAVSVVWIVLFTVLSVRCFQREGEKRFGVREAAESLKAAN